MRLTFILPLVSTYVVEGSHAVTLFVTPGGSASAVICLFASFGECIIEQNFTFDGGLHTRWISTFD